MPSTRHQQAEPAPAVRLSSAACLVIGVCVFFSGPALAGPPAEDDTAYRAGIGLLNKGVPDLAAAELKKYLAANASGASVTSARYALGVCLVKLGRHAEAAAELDRVIAIKDFEFAADAAFLRAQCAVAVGDEAGALRALRALIEEHSEFAHLDLATALLGEVMYLTGDPEGATRVLASVAERWPGSAARERAELFCAMAESAVGDGAAGAKRASELRARAPEGKYSASAALVQARCLHTLRDWKGSGAAYEAAMRSSEPGVRTEATLGRAQVARAEGNAEGALHVLDQFDAMDAPASLRAAASLERGRVLYDLGRAEDGLRVLNDADAGADGALADDRAYWAAKCELKLGRNDAAAERLERAAAKCVNSSLAADMLFDRAVALARAGKDEAALAAWIDWTARFPRHALTSEAIGSQAACLHRLGRFEESLSACGKTPQSTSAGNSGTALLVAENLFLLNRFKEAESAYGAFVARFSTDPNTWRARVRRGLCLVRLGQAEDASDVLSEAVSEPGGPDLQDPSLRRAALSALADHAWTRSNWPAAEHWFVLLAAATREPAESADALLRAGLSVQRQGRASEAAELFERAIGSGRGSAPALHARFELGQTLVESGRTDEARAAFEAVLADNTPEGAALKLHAIRHLAAIASREGRPEDAAALLARLPEGESGGAALMQQGAAWMSAGKFKEAERVYSTAMSEPGAGGRALEARARRAIAINRQGQHTDALEELDAVGKGEPGLDPETALAVRYERALALRSLGRDGEAGEAYRDLLESSPGPALEAFGALDLAQLEVEGGRYEQALTLLDRSGAAASKLGTSEAARIAERATYLRGMCMLRAGKPSEAVAVLAPFRAAYPESKLHAHVGLALGESLIQSGRGAEAAAELKRVVDSAVPEDLAAIALLRLADALCSAGQWTMSEESYSAFLDRFKQHDQWFQARFGQGWCREQQGRIDGAIEAYRDVAAHHSGPTAARAQFQIGECLYAQKHHQDAVAEFLKVDVLFAYPEWSAAALYEAGRCLLEINRTAEAARQFTDVQSRFPDSKWAALARQKSDAAKPEPLPGRAGASARGDK